MLPCSDTNTGADCIEPNGLPRYLGDPTRDMKAVARIGAPMHGPVHRAPAEMQRVMIRGHEIIAELGNNQKLLAALRALDNNSQALTTACADGLKFMKSKRVKLPAKTKISFKRRRKGWEMDLHVAEPGFTYKYRYNSERGLIH